MARRWAERAGTIADQVVGDAPRLAAGVGWINLALGVFLAAAPGTAAGLMGLGDRPRLARAVGASDLAIGGGLLLGRDRARWMEARAAANVAIAGLCGWALAAGTPRRGRAVGLLAAMAVLTPVDGLLARRLRSAAEEREPEVHPY